MFGKRFKLFKLMGFQVNIDLSWIFIALLIAWSLSTGFFPVNYKDLSTTTYWIMGIVGAAGLFLSIIAHEFCHSLVARKFGIPMKGITLFIFGGVAEMNEEPASAKAEFLMAAAGPLSSILIAGLFYTVYVWGKNSLPPAVNGIFGYLAMINTVLAVFNIIPAFPLDGGRILRSILWGIKKDLRWATKIASWMGTAFGVFLVFIGVLRLFMGFLINGMWLVLIGIFLQNAAQMSQRQIVLRRAFEGEPVRRFMSPNPITVRASTTIETLIEDYIYRFHHKFFPVIDDDENLIGCISTKQVKPVTPENRNKITVGELSSQCSPENSIAADEDAMAALARMRQYNASRFLVLDRGRLVGILSLKDLLEFLSLKMELEG